MIQDKEVEKQQLICSNPKLLDYHGLLEHFRNNQKIVRELYSYFIAELPERLAEFEGALAAQDMQLLAKISHSLKGVAGQLKASTLFDISLEMEMAGRNEEWEKIIHTYPKLKDALNKVSEAMKYYFPNDNLENI